MDGTTKRLPHATRRILESLLDESVRAGEALDTAEMELREALDELSAFREATPNWSLAFSCTAVGQQRDLLESRLRAAVRRRDQCSGSNDLATGYRRLIEQALRQG